MDIKKYYQLVYSPKWQTLTDDEKKQIQAAVKKARFSKKYLEMDQKVSGLISSVEQEVA